MSVARLVANYLSYTNINLSHRIIKYHIDILSLKVIQTIYKDNSFDISNCNQILS